MPNYKSFQHLKTQDGGIRLDIPEVGKAKELFFMVQVASTAKSLFDIDDNLVYKTPSGRYFKILVISWEQGSSSNGSFQIDSSSTQDTSGTLIQTLPYTWGILRQIHYSFPAGLTIGQNRYVTLDQQGVVMNWIRIIGYEYDKP